MDDVIYRQDAIDAIEDCAEFIKDIHQLVTLIDADTAKTKVRAIPSAQQWIPCAERLPEDGTYLCWEWQGFCYVDSFKDGNWETAEKCYTKCIAWMPLPEPYKEETDETD